MTGFLDQQLLLLQAIAEEDASTQDAWQAWRAVADFTDLYISMHLIISISYERMRTWKQVDNL